MVITVKAKELKPMFEVLVSLNVECVGLTVDGDKLYITAAGSIPWQSHAEIIDSIDKVDLTQSVYFTSVANLIGRRGTVKITFTQFNCTLEYGKLKVTLDNTVEIVNKIDIPNIEFRPVCTGLLVEALKTLNSSLAIQKSLIKDASYELRGDIAYVKYPTVWIKARSSGLETILSKYEATCIIKFSPLMMADDGNFIYLANGDQTLILPRNTLPADTFKDVAKDFRFSCDLDTKGLFTEIDRIYKCTGVCDITCYISNNNMYFSVKKSNFGLTTNVGEYEVAFTTSIEYMVYFLKILGDRTVQVSVKKNEAIMFTSNDLCIMFSI